VDAVKKFIEVGIGNRWFIRTEIEHADGTESEQRGLCRFKEYHFLYLRTGVGHMMLILDTKEGIKRLKKNRRAFKILIGISGI
jgi:hypothetical protein